MKDLLWLIYQARIALIYIMYSLECSILTYCTVYLKNKSFYCTTLLLIDDEVLVKVDRSNTHRRDIYLWRVLDECMK